MSELTRRGLLGSFGYFAASRLLTAQAPPIRVRSLNHMTLAVADATRSQQFYQDLFGLPVQARQGSTTVLRIGAGPQFVALNKIGANAKPGIHHFCMTVDNFDSERILKILAAHGVTKTDAASTEPFKAWVRVRREDTGGAKEGTPELYFTDPDGIVVEAAFLPPGVCTERLAAGALWVHEPLAAWLTEPWGPDAPRGFHYDVRGTQRDALDVRRGHPDRGHDRDPDG